MNVMVKQKSIRVPTLIPTGVSVLLTGFVATRALDYLKPAGQPQDYLRLLNEIGYQAWGWILVGCGVALCVGIVARLGKHYTPLLMAHIITGTVYGFLTSLIISAGPHPHAFRAWMGAALTAGFHFLRIVSLLYERLTEQANISGYQ